MQNGETKIEKNIAKIQGFGESSIGKNVLLIKENEIMNEEKMNHCILLGAE